MNPPETERRLYTPEALDALLEFCALHPVGTWNAEMQRRFFAEIVSGPEAIIDLWRDGRRVLAAVVIDTCENATDSASFELLGLKRGGDERRRIDQALELAEACARRGPKPHLVTTVEEVLTAEEELSLSAALLEARGYHEAWRDYLMVRPAGLPLPPPPPPLPSSFRWVDLDDSRGEAYHQVLRAAFKGVPSANIQSLEQVMAAHRRQSIPNRLLLDDDTVVGFVNVSLGGDDGREGEIRTLGRRPDYHARGLGPHLLYEGLRRLADRGADRYQLSVTAGNERALALYLRFGFEPRRTFRQYLLRL